MPIPISWTPGTYKVSRNYVEPAARQGYEYVTLAWLQKHCEGLAYRVRWWEGTDGTRTRDQWKTQDTESAVSLRDVKTFASMIAGTVTPWEVEITLVGRVHTNEGWDRGTVWTFGHYQRETDEAKATRARMG